VAQSCLDDHLQSLKSSSRLPRTVGFCYDREGFWKLWKEAASYAKLPSDRWKATYCYGLAYDYGFHSSLFNLDYASFLVNNKRLDEALKVLQQIPVSDGLFYNGKLKQVEILIWLGEYNKSSKLLSEIEAGETGMLGRSKNNLIRTTDSLSSPVIQYEVLSNFDNQPLGYVGNNVVFRKGSSAMVNYQFSASNSLYFGQNSNHQFELYGQNTFSIRKLNGALTLGIGGSMFQLNNLRLTYHAEVKNQFSKSLSNTMRVERKVYDLTRGSIGNSLLVDQLSNSLRFSVRSGLSFECFGSLGSLVKANSSQWNIYGWGLSPYLLRYPLAIRAGAFVGYSNSDRILFESKYTYGELVDMGITKNIPGVFTTWFTPKKMASAGIITDVQYNATKRLSIHFTGTVGYGITQEPYFFLESNSIVLDSYSKNFIPVDVKFGSNYNLSRTLSLKLNYEYRITVFNRANYLSLSLSKRMS
jgi:hypothetical protein